MDRHIREFWRGVGSLCEHLGRTRSTGGYADDRRELSGDMARVGGDFAAAMDQLGSPETVRERHLDAAGQQHLFEP